MSTVFPAALAVLLTGATAFAGGEKPVRDRAFDLARRWCDALIARQISCPADNRIDGAIACPACGLTHGRIADLVYPFVYFNVRTGEDRYLDAARRVIEWNERMMVRQDGGMYNDYKSGWWPVTAFSQAAIGRTLLRFGARLPDDFRDRLRAVFVRESEFLDRKIDDAFLGRVNVNYPAAMCESMILAYELLGDGKWKAKAQKIRRRLEGAILEDGLLRGEGHPIEETSARGRAFVDLGYNMEETLPALYEYAIAAGDRELEAEVVRSFRTHFEFMLPDGALDDSCGSRAEKWTYYGSRTSDGMIAFLGAMALRGEPGAWTAVDRHLALLERCTGEDGLLAGGPGYGCAGEPACVHHAFAHVKSLVQFLMLEGEAPAVAGGAMPREAAYGVKAFGSMGVELVSTGPWRATFSTTDATISHHQGNFQVSGGSPALLWHRELGPVAVGTMSFYKMTEEHNMQDLRKEMKVLTMTPRLEDGGFHSAADGTAELVSEFRDGVYRASARGRLTNIFGKQSFGYAFEHRLDVSGFTMKATSEKAARFVFPVVIGGKDVVSYSKAPSAEDGRYRVTITKAGGRKLVLESDRELKPLVTDRGETAFSPVAGFLYTCAAAELPDGGSVTVRLAEAGE